MTPLKVDGETDPHGDGMAGDVTRPDPYCPLIRGEQVHLDWQRAAERELLKMGSACTTVLAPA